MSLHTAKIKCRLFLSNLLQLTMEDKPESMVAMQSLVQALIDGQLKPTKFMSKISQELKAAPVLKTGLEVFRKVNFECFFPPFFYITKQLNKFVFPFYRTVYPI